MSTGSAKPATWTPLALERRWPATCTPPELANPPPFPRTLFAHLPEILVARLAPAGATLIRLEAGQWDAARQAAERLIPKPPGSGCPIMARIVAFAGDTTPAGTHFGITADLARFGFNLGVPIKLPWA